MIDASMLQNWGRGPSSPRLRSIGAGSWPGQRPRVLTRAVWSLGSSAWPGQLGNPHTAYKADQAGCCRLAVAGRAVGASFPAASDLSPPGGGRSRAAGFEGGCQMQKDGIGLGPNGESSNINPVSVTMTAPHSQGLVCKPWVILGLARYLTNRT